MDTASGRSNFSALDLLSQVTFVNVGKGFSKKYNVTFEKLSVVLPSFVTVPPESTASFIVSLMEHVLENVLKDVSQQALVRLRIESKFLDFPIWTPPTLRSQLSVERWMDEIQRVLNSNEDFKLEGTFSVEVHHAMPPSGKGHTLLDKKLRSKGCIIQIQNKDDICLARALVVGKAYADGGDYRSLYRTKKPQTNAAYVLMGEAGLEYREFSTADLPSFEKVSLPSF